MIRQTESLLEMGLVDDICVVSAWEAGLPRHENKGNHYKIVRVNLHFSRYAKNIITNVLRYLEFTLKVFRIFRKAEIRVINCHSLFTLPIGVLLKKYGKSGMLVYNAQELETEKCGLSRSVRYFSKMLEKALIGHVDSMTVVSPNIANWYSREYGISKIYLMRNVPEKYGAAKKHSNYFRKHFDIPSTSLVYLYQGLVGYGRGIEMLLDVFTRDDCRHHLVVMGYGLYTNRVIGASESHDNVHFHPAVSPHQLLSYTTSADVGLCMIENVCLSYYYCLPNKMFEYLHSGIPVVASKFPDMEEVINGYDCGWVSPVDCDSLAALVGRLSFADIREKAPGLEFVREEVHWDSEKNILRNIFE